MAGSYHHVIDDDGRLCSPKEDPFSLLENMGDMAEALDECLSIIHILSEGNHERVNDVVREMYRRYSQGDRIWYS